MRNRILFALAALAVVCSCKKSREAEVPELVDLGLSVKWRSWNLGATKPEEFGDYYAWGETEPKKNYWTDTYAWGSDYDALTKYCPSDKTEYWAGEGDPDGKTVLDSEDDAARVRLGGKWRMPTVEEWEELYDYDNCFWEWTAINGVNGYRVTSKKAGFTDRWIFFPAAGCQRGTYTSDVGIYGYYWTSSLVESLPNMARARNFQSGALDRNGGTRFYGQSIRPVSE